MACVLFDMAACGFAIDMALHYFDMPAFYRHGSVLMAPCFTEMARPLWPYVFIVMTILFYRPLADWGWESLVSLP